MSRMTTSHVALAIGHLDAVATFRETLRDLYDQQRHVRHAGPELGGRIAECHQSIGHGLKAAGIHAQIAQAIALEAIAKGPTPTKVLL